MPSLSYTIVLQSVTAIDADGMAKKICPEALTQLSTAINFDRKKYNDFRLGIAYTG